MTTDVRQLQQAFDEAEWGADTDALNALPADDFRSIGEKGYVLDKAQWVGKFAEFAYTSLETTDIEVSLAENRPMSTTSAPWNGSPRSRYCFTLP